jgi:hypothetical protein
MTFAGGAIQAVAIVPDAVPVLLLVLKLPWQKLPAVQAISMRKAMPSVATGALAVQAAMPARTRQVQGA